MARMLGVPAELWYVFGPVANCAWSIIGTGRVVEGRATWRVLEHNAGTLPEPVLSDDR
jgi:probable phosphoglycerate mutase